MATLKEEKCSGCELFSTLCICASITPFATATRLSLIIHRSEAGKMTNTGKLASKLLTNSQVFVFGRKEAPLQASDFFHPDYCNVLLYPGKELSSSDISSWKKPVNLVVPDGNWQQAKTIAHRIKNIMPLHMVGLPVGLPSEYVLRSHPDLHRVCTIEAIYRFLKLVENEAPAERLLELFRLARDRLLKKRGFSCVTP